MYSLPAFIHGVMKSLGVESGNKARFYIHGVAIMTTILLPHFEDQYYGSG